MPSTARPRCPRPDPPRPQTRRPTRAKARAARAAGHTTLPPNRFASFRATTRDALLPGGDVAVRTGAQEMVVRSAGGAATLSPPVPAPVARADRGRCPLGSGTAPRGWTPGDRPHPPTPSPMAMGEGEQLSRGRVKPSPGPPDCRGAAASRWIPPPGSHGDGRGGWGVRESQRALPRSAMPLPDGHLPCHLARGEGEHVSLGAKPSPRSPSAAARPLPDGEFPAF